VSWWPGDGDAIDIVGGNDGALVGNATFAPGFVGEAFSTSGGAVALSTQPPLAEGFTIDAWVNFDDTNFDTDQTIFGNNQAFLRKNIVGEGNGFAVFVRLDDGSVEPRAQSTTVPVAGAWTHVAGTWDGTILKIYVNGRLEDISLRRGSLTTPVGQARIGSSLFGRVDEVEIFDRALASSKIRAIFEAGSAGKWASRDPALNMDFDSERMQGDLLRNE
jgi:hypothetical protein